ncbi:MAG: ABC transporter permease [Acidobacteriales bacterium]|nr:ABC transporter permease [Terriglobales bacterium]
MSTQSSTMPASPLHSPGIGAVPPIRPLLWSVQREIWEYRSLYLAPAAVAALVVFGFLISTTVRVWEKSLRVDLAQQPEKLVEPYNFAALLLMATSFVVAVFYSLEALYGERRDRSILFWKSLPVSDLTTVLAKFSIPVLFIPLLTFSITVAMHVIMLVMGSAALLAQGESVTALWNQLRLFHIWSVLLYHYLALHGLWYAPIFGWLLVVSAWARRVPILWAALPVAVIAIVENLIYNTSYLGRILGNRMMGGADPVTPAGSTSMDALMHPSPSELLASPGLWIGFAIAAAFLALAVQLRRYREPI